MSALRAVPGNNEQMAESGVITPVRSAGLLWALTGTLRAVQGKRPVSDVRESVKMILRLFAGKEWSKLSEVKLAATKAYELSQNVGQSDPLGPVYRSVLALFGGELTIYLLEINSRALPETDKELLDMKEFVSMQSRTAEIMTKGLVGSLRLYPSLGKPSGQNIADVGKIASLVDAAVKGVKGFFVEKNQQIDYARKYIKTFGKSNANFMREWTQIASDFEKRSNTRRNSKQGGLRRKSLRR